MDVDVDMAASMSWVCLEKGLDICQVAGKQWPLILGYLQ